MLTLMNFWSHLGSVGADVVGGRVVIPACTSTLPMLSLNQIWEIDGNLHTAPKIYNLQVDQKLRILVVFFFFFRRLLANVAAFCSLCCWPAETRLFIEVLEISMFTPASLVQRVTQLYTTRKKNGETCNSECSLVKIQKCHRLCLFTFGYFGSTATFLALKILRRVWCNVAASPSVRSSIEPLHRSALQR